MEYDGIVDCTNQEYHSEITHLSSSNYKLLLTDLETFYKEKILKEPRILKEGSHFVDGSYLHSLILEPDKVAEEYSIFPGFRKAGPDWEAFKAASDPKKTLLSNSQSKKIQGWYKHYLNNKMAVDLIKGGSSEVSLFSTFRDIPTKVRADYINSTEGYIVDVKTTSFGLDKDDFKMTMSSFYYPLSAALYLNMFESHFKKKFEFYFIVVGKTELGCRVFKLSKESRELGESQLAEAARIYKNCLSSGDWSTKNTKSTFDEEEIEEV